MDRRSLLKKILFGVPALAAASSIVVAQPAPVPEIPNRFEFHGWDVYWTGWKDWPNQDLMVGQWLAKNPTKLGWNIYSSWPGACGPYLPLATLDISVKELQLVPVPGVTSEFELNWMRNECLERLKRIIVKVGPPPFDYISYRETKGWL